MNVLGQMTLGIVILLLLALLVAIKRAATGAVLDRPQGNFLEQLVNVFNLFFLLVVNPLAAILLIARRVEAVDITHWQVGDRVCLNVLEVTGLSLYVAGFFLMAWALMTLGHSYQLGGTAPRREDVMITGGPYKLVWHPMYAAALSISLGLAFVIQSWLVLCVFGVYVLLLLRLIPLEEDKLLKAYGEQYVAYRRKTPMLIFFSPVSSARK